MKKNKTPFERLRDLRAKVSQSIRFLERLEVTETRAITYICQDGTSVERNVISEGEVVKVKELNPIINDLREAIKN